MFFVAPESSASWRAFTAASDVSSPQSISSSPATCHHPVYCFSQPTNAPQQAAIKSSQTQQFQENAKFAICHGISRFFVEFRACIVNCATVVSELLTLSPLSSHSIGSPQPWAPSHNIIWKSFCNEVTKPIFQPHGNKSKTYLQAGISALRVFIKDEQASFQVLWGERVKSKVMWSLGDWMQASTCMWCSRDDSILKQTLLNSHASAAK